MSHDIRTPLNGIIGYLDLEDGNLQNQELLLQYRKNARVAANHLLSLINDVLNMSKLEDDKVEFAHEAFDLCELAGDILALTEIHAKETGITLQHSDCSMNILHPYVYGSPLHVRQIFVNILNNAVKYNRPGGTISCKMETEKQEGNRIWYSCTIQDTGIGMKPEFLKHLFDPFAQEKVDARSVYHGTGLGMAIVKELLDRMDGTIQIDSVENQGTTIHVVIPFEIAEEPAVVQEMSELPKENLSGCRILLAEDNELNREIAAFLLKDEGISVTEAEDGQQAVECFLKMPEGYYDAVLMDIMMPVMDGYQAARAIRGSGKKDAEMIPIIAITANAFAEDKRKTMEAGMDAHLSKPLNVQELMDTIRKFCAGKQICQ